MFVILTIIDKRRNKIFRVREFEKKISKHFGSKYVQCVSSGTAAITSSVGYNEGTLFKRPNIDVKSPINKS